MKFFTAPLQVQYGIIILYCNILLAFATIQGDGGWGGGPNRLFAPSLGLITFSSLLLLFPSFPTILTLLWYNI
jgi:hypothetical protein